MYFGRVVCVGQTHDGHMAMFYRLASQACPGREIIGNNDELRVVPKVGWEGDFDWRNSFLTYTAFIRVPDFTVVGNGDHTKAIAQVIQDGSDPYRTLGRVLADYGPEEDGLNTPRIVGVLSAHENRAWIGIVGQESLHVEICEPRPGGWSMVATEFRDRQYIQEDFRPIRLKSLADFVCGQEQGTMATIIVVQKQNELEVEVQNY